VKVTETKIALAALILSLGVTGAASWRWFQGPVVSVVAPDQVLLYRSGEVLNVAVRLPLINGASEYNDLVTSAQMQPGPNHPKFPLTEIAVPIFNDDRTTEGQKDHCEEVVRCQRFKGMAISQRPDTVVTVPAGGAQTHYYSFEMFCSGQKKCERYSDFQSTVEALRDDRLILTIWLDLYKDGERIVHCEVESVDVDDLLVRQWQTLECRRSEVVGN
jgi:hypothetical protein